MSAYLDAAPRSLRQFAGELDAKIKALREAIAHHQRMVREHEDHLLELYDRRDAIGDELVRRAR
jgi:hypothetical protein